MVIIHKDTKPHETQVWIHVTRGDHGDPTEKLAIGIFTFLERQWQRHLLACVPPIVGYGRWEWYNIYTYRVRFHGRSARLGTVDISIIIT